MNDTTTLPIDEFLGTTTRPRWRRWAKFWVPGLIVLLLGLYFVTRGDDGKPKYISEPVVQRSLDIEVTATGNLRPTNQVDVGSEVSGRVDRVLVDVNDRVEIGRAHV